MTDTRLRLAGELALPEDAVTQTFAILAKRGAAHAPSRRTRPETITSPLAHAALYPRVQAYTQ